MKSLIKKINTHQLFKNKKFIVNFLAVIILVECAIYFYPGFGDKISLEEYANKIVSTCESASHRPTCYDKTIPDLMDYVSMEDAFKITFLVQGKDPEYAYCHVLAHELSAREVIKDPSRWKDVATRSPSGICSNGGIHGAFQERFRGEFFTDEELVAIKPELMDLCEKRENWSPTGLEQASCYHAMGHLTMYLTEADINRSLVLCDDLAVKGNRDYKHLCYDGVFMQIFQPLEPEDFSLIKGKEITKDTHEKFCDKFTGEAKGSCWSEGWPLYRQELMKDPKALTAYCKKASTEERERCFSSIMYVMTAMFNLDATKVMSYCPGLQGEEIGKCFASAAGRMIEVDYRNIKKAVDLCSASAPHDPKNACFSMILVFSRYNYKPESPEFYEVCNSLPEMWKNKCLEKK